MTTNVKKKKSAREKRILVASLIVAAVMIGGSTFAWFTSKDEVTNRLSASANYGVAISEDFTPPEDWVPGQEINKDVSVTNTGNVDAFVRTWIEGELRYVGVAATPLKAIGASGNVESAKIGDKASSGALKDSGLCQYDSGDTYVKQLNNITTDAGKENASGTGKLSEVQALQAGGWLAYAPTDADWQYTEAADDANPSDISGATTVYSSKTSSVTVDATTTLSTDYKGVAVNSETFKPKTTGLYLFRRNADMDDLDANAKVQYSGYYYVAGSGYGDGKYYALTTEFTTTTNDGTTVSSSLTPVTATESSSVYAANITAVGDELEDADVANVTLYTAEKKVLTSDKLYWRMSDASTIYVTNNKKDNATAADNAITIKIKLDNIGTDAEQWTTIAGTTANYVQTNSIATFYYNNDVEEGATTSKIIDSVTLDESVTSNAFITMDFDLNVKMESVQVTKDSGGKETTVPVTPWNAHDNAFGVTTATAEYNGTPNAQEITKITWAK